MVKCSVDGARGYGIGMEKVALLPFFPILLVYRFSIPLPWALRYVPKFRDTRRERQWLGSLGQFGAKE